MTMPKNLILIRHGYSEANDIQKKQEQGIHEETVTIPDREWKLTDKGVKQAQSIGRIFDLDNPVLSQIDTFYVSPYRRTLETANNLLINYAQ